MKSAGNDNRRADGSQNPPCSGDIVRAEHAGFLTNGYVTASVTVPVVEEACMAGEGCATRRVAKALLQTSTFGGNNYRIRARFTPAPMACVDPEPEEQEYALPPDDPPPALPAPRLTVWRRLYYYPDRSTAPLHADIPEEAWIAGAFMDAFYEMVPQNAATPAHAYWLRYSLDQDNATCDQGLAPDEISPNSLGVITYGHQYIPDRYGGGANHPPEPRHTVQILGVHILAEEVDGRFQGNFRGKVFGIWCNQPPKDGERVKDWVHAAVALHNIEKAWEYEKKGDFYYNEKSMSYPWACDVFGVPEGARFVRQESRLLARNMTLHELGHAVLRLARHPEGLCRDIVDPGGTPTQSIMDYSCLYNRNFEGFFSYSEITHLREGSGME